MIIHKMGIDKEADENFFYKFKEQLMRSYVEHSIKWAEQMNARNLRGAQYVTRPNDVQELISEFGHLHNVMKLSPKGHYELYDYHHCEYDYEVMGFNAQAPSGELFVLAMNKVEIEETASLIRFPQMIDSYNDDEDDYDYEPEGVDVKIIKQDILQMKRNEFEALNSLDSDVRDLLVSYTKAVISKCKQFSGSEEHKAIAWNFVLQNLFTEDTFTFGIAQIYGLHLLENENYWHRRRLDELEANEVDVRKGCEAMIKHNDELHEFFTANAKKHYPNQEVVEINFWGQVLRYKFK